MSMTNPPPTAPPVAPHEVEVFYDGECPLCRKEIGMIRRMDRRGLIRFTDITEEGFDPSLYGATHQRLMAEIHGRDAKGRWITGVEVFRQLYSAVGLGPVVAATRLPLVKQGLDGVYSWFAKRRLWLTGRCDSGVCGVDS